ncbi:cache domain-containing sensor histidine kinase [Paenibacillus abyssi]|uniref:histidine kinase n=1 Tax=Paenibacillus abyssi TaxID=1340531 RepID=A0A917FT26_9BACL|nr:histidine kinase [Paenibacillus abyssi]GGG00913.1 hypothetical protein GCM10010916_17580 [Paenibacillus abyssi]
MSFLSSIVNRIDNMLLRKKLIISFFVVVVIPLAIAGAIFTYTLYNSAVTRAIEQTENNVDKILKRTTDLLNVPIVISHKVQLDQELKQLVTTRYESAWDNVKAYTSYNEFTDNERLYDEINSIRVYSNNPTVLDRWGLLQSDASVRNTAWHREALENNGLIGWDLVVDELNKNSRTLSLTRKISYGKKEPIYGVLVVNLKQEALDNIISQEQYETLIISDNDKIVAAKDTALIGRNIGGAGLDPEHFRAMTSGFVGRTSFDVVINGEHMKAIVDRFLPDTSASGITVVAMVPYETILRDVKKTGLLAIAIMIGSLLLSSVLIYFFSLKLSSRIRKLCMEIKTVSLGNLDVTSTIQGRDEFGQLASHFNHMVQSIKNLVQKVSETNSQKHQLMLKQKEMKFKMLANQINPHFLFNTLETIRMKAHVAGQQEISTAVQQLGMLMRRSLNIKSDNIPLKDELDFVVDYLEIQRFRYGDRLQYAIEVENLALYKLPIPPFTIQPIIENAVIHGLECKEEQGFIQLKVSFAGAGALITVQDNGLGISRERLEEIQALFDQEENTTSSSIGLCNVHQRIALRYGVEYGLRIESEMDKGTKVEIYLPREDEEVVQSASSR